ncbi:MAG: methyltransferase domain-containing protein [Chloroflexi bacterium]|uniref:Methyltransferase domain-containing protein n=1 Tax=Candidatus Chlorohelix allophototropha TaxID=3003348 RepID=A0A8T7M821_9CHLR|nr:methyltransferase domain-containing protein [Chloroflexota bacterium]WJW68137.1 methyltransferase domain-containing protein [Chloroflexota bacterium L227-S17]
MSLKLAEQTAPASTEMRLHEYGIMYNVEDNFWWYEGMRRNLLSLLQRHWDWQAKPNPVVLDAGCGTGATLQHLAAGFEGEIATNRAVGFDISSEALRFCRRRKLDRRLFQGSITAIPVADNSIDILVSFEVISNLSDPEPGFREVARVLNHGGLAIIKLPAYQFLYSEHDIAVRVLRRFNRGEVQALLAKHGLAPVRMSYLNTFLFPPAAISRLIKKFLLKNKVDEELESDLKPPHPLLNKILIGIMAQEARVLRHTNFNLPFGLSLITVARKV